MTTTTAPALSASSALPPDFADLPRHVQVDLVLALPAHLTTPRPR